MPVSDTRNPSSENKDLEDIKFAHDTVMNCLGRIMPDIKFLKERMPDPHVGKNQKILILTDLKTAFPRDGFTGRCAVLHVTDIVTAVREPNAAIGKVSISAKYHKKWNSELVSQLEGNAKYDDTKSGFLVSTVFPTETPNENVWTALTGSGKIILITSPNSPPSDTMLLGHAYLRTPPREIVRTHAVRQETNHAGGV